MADPAETFENGATTLCLMYFPGDAWAIVGGPSRRDGSMQRRAHKPADATVRLQNVGTGECLRPSTVRQSCF